MLKHILNGVKYNVKKINNIKVSKRFIKIKEPDLTYKLSFDYEEPSNSSYLIPVITTNIGIGFSTNTIHETHKTYKIYYKTKLEAENEMNIIIKKQLFMKNNEKKLEKKLEREFILMMGKTIV